MDLEEQREAAIRLQAVQRGNLAREELGSQKQAATILQAVQRGNIARKEVSDPHLILRILT